MLSGRLDRGGCQTYRDWNTGFRAYPLIREALDSANLNKLVKHRANRDSCTILRDQFLEAASLPKNWKDGWFTISVQEPWIVEPACESSPRRLPANLRSSARVNKLRKLCYLGTR